MAALVAAVALAAQPAAAQDSFGEAADDAAAAADSRPAAPAVTVGGELEFRATAFLREGGGAPLAGAAIGRLEFAASGAAAEAFLRLEVSRENLAGSPADLLDEAYVRLFAGPATLEGGLMKVVWGKADSEGPLDVLNPLDYTDLTVTDILERKIARPMARVSIALGDFTTLEIVGLPGFEGNRVAWDGLWEPARIKSLKASALAYDAAYGGGDLDATKEGNVLSYPDTGTLGYSQAGLRLSTTIGPCDLGAQYFYGYLPTPAVSAAPATLGALATAGTPLPVSYDRYHQIGADCAAVVAGFGVRAEAAASLTEDLQGDDPGAYNPFLAWSLGFDRGLGAGLELAAQCGGTWRLFEHGISSPYDLEAGADRASARLTACVSQRLARDTVEWQAKGLYDIEDGDYLLLPSLRLAIGDGAVSLEAGIFGGDEEGELGQYADASYLRAAMSYRF